MENARGQLVPGSSGDGGGQDPLPTGSPLDIDFPSLDDLISCPKLGSQGFSKSIGELPHHRASSDSFLMEQPSWFDELLNEPESPLVRGHQLSSSDSCALLSMEVDSFGKEESKTLGIAAVPSWEYHGSGLLESLCEPSSHSNGYSIGEQQRKPWESSFTTPASLTGLETSQNGTTTNHELASSVPSKATAKKNQGGPKGLSVKNNKSNANPNEARTDAKQARQQLAQCSRSRKLKYIGDLEKSIEILQIEESRVLAALQYLDHQLLLLGMENQVLKQRLDSLYQEQLMKDMEQNMLERELARLQCLLNQQQQKQKQKQKQKRSTCRKPRRTEVELQLANLSIEQKQVGILIPVNADRGT